MRKLDGLIGLAGLLLSAAHVPAQSIFDDPDLNGRSFTPGRSEPTPPAQPTPPPATGVPNSPAPSPSVPSSSVPSPSVPSTRPASPTLTPVGPVIPTTLPATAVPDLSFRVPTVDIPAPANMPPAAEVIPGLCLEYWTRPAGQSQLLMRGVITGDLMNRFVPVIYPGETTILRWRGWLRVEKDCVMALWVHGGPKLKLSIGNRLVFDLTSKSDYRDCRRDVRVAAGYHEFSVETEGTTTADARVLTCNGQMWQPLGVHDLVCRPIALNPVPAMQPPAAINPFAPHGLILESYCGDNFDRLESCSQITGRFLISSNYRPTPPATTIQRSAKVYGYIHIRTADRYRLDLVGDIDYTVEIDGKPVQLSEFAPGQRPKAAIFSSRLPWRFLVMDLKPGLYPIRATFARMKAIDPNNTLQFRLVPDSADVNTQARTDLLVAPVSAFSHRVLTGAEALAAAKFPSLGTSGFGIPDRPYVPSPDRPRPMEAGLIAELYSGPDFSNFVATWVSPNPVSDRYIADYGYARSVSGPLSIRYRGWLNVETSGTYDVAATYLRHGVTSVRIGGVEVLRTDSGGGEVRQVRLDKGLHSVVIEAIAPGWNYLGYTSSYDRQSTSPKIIVGSDRVVHGDPGPSRLAAPVVTASRTLAASPPPMASAVPPTANAPVTQTLQPGMSVEQFDSPDFQRPNPARVTKGFHITLNRTVSGMSVDGLVPYSFRAKGFVQIKDRGAYSFRLVADGNVAITLGGTARVYSTDNPAPQVMNLAPGTVPIMIEISRLKPVGDQISLMLEWKRDGVHEWEKIPVGALYYTSTHTAGSAIAGGPSVPATRPTETAPVQAQPPVRSRLSLRSTQPTQWPAAVPRVVGVIRPVGPAVPGASAVGLARSEIRKQNADYYASNRAVIRQSLVAKLTSEVDKLPQPERRMAMLLEIADLGASLSDAGIVRGAVDRTLQAFAADAPAALSMVGDVIAPNADRVPAVQPELLALGYAQLAKAESAGSFSTCAALCSTMISLAKKDVAAATDLRAKLEHYRLLQAEAARIAPLIERLRTSPDNADAIQQVGKYECLVRGNWSAGLALLARSTDLELKLIASMEMQPAIAETELLRLGSAWIDRAKLERAPYSTRCRDRGFELLQFVLEKGRTESSIDQAFDAIVAAKTAQPLMERVDLRSAATGTKAVWQGRDILLDLATVRLPMRRADVYELAVDFTLLEDATLDITVPAAGNAVKVTLSTDRPRFDTETSDQTWTPGVLPTIKKRQTLTIRVKDGQVEVLLNGVPAGKTLIARAQTPAESPSILIGARDGQVLCQGVRLRTVTP